MIFKRRWRDRTAPLRKPGMQVLLALLLIMVFVVPFIAPSSSLAGRIFQDLLLSLILLSGAVTATDRPKGFMLVALVAVITIAVRSSEWFAPMRFMLVIRKEATLLALVLLTVIIAIRVFGPGKVTRDRIAGAVALYILAGVVWADAYDLVSLQVAGAFSGQQHSEIPGDPSVWIYFSFVTLTTVGYGDIVPVAHAARSLSNLEALIGQLYPAIVLARLVSLQVEASGSATDKL